MKTYPGLKPRNRFMQKSRAAQEFTEEAHWKTKLGPAGTFLRRRLSKREKLKQQSIPNFQEISELQFVDYSSKIRRNQTRKLGTKMETFGCSNQIAALGKSWISGN